MALIKLAVIQFFAAVGLKLWPYCEPAFKRYKGLGFILFLFCIAGILATLLTGCQTQQLAEKEPLYQYKADMEITVDGKTFEGMAVTKLDGPKTISIKSFARLDLLKVSSCHREMIEEKVRWRDGWFGLGGQSAKEYTFVYDPMKVESEFYCPLYIEAYEKGGGFRAGTMAAWGFIAFRSPEGAGAENLPARAECNGTLWTKFAGITVCQARTGMEQSISFDRPVRVVHNDKCKIEPKSDREFRVRSTEFGFCRAVFTDGKDKHRLELLGYTEVLVRGE